MDEAAHRFNVRHQGERERFDRAMKDIAGKRMTHKALTNGCTRQGVRPIRCDAPKG